MNSHIRKKNLFKQDVCNKRKSYYILKLMNRNQNDLHNLNNELLLQIKLEIDLLIAYHEQIFISISKKARYDISHFDSQIENPQKKDLMDAFQREIIKDPYQTT